MAKYKPKKQKILEEIDEETESGEEDIYTEEGRESLAEDDEISPVEEGFMEGAEGKGKLGKCALCGKPLGGEEDIVEREVKGELYWFCSDKCAQRFKKR